MQDLRIVTVRSQLQQRQFIELPLRIHGHDPKFVPALARDESRLLGFVSGHPFAEENEVQAWLAMRGASTVGRIAAVNNWHQEGQSSEGCGHFGFFAVENDPEAATALIQTAAAWSRNRNLEILRGPFSPSINYTVGLLQSGFESQPSIQIPYNPSYYSKLLQNAGMSCCQELYALELAQQQMTLTVPRLERIADRLTNRYRVNFRQLNPHKTKRDLGLFLSIAQRSLQNHWGFVPLSARERVQLIDDMSWIVTPKMLYFAEIDKEAVGAALAIADLAECVRRIRGKLTPVGFLKLLWAKRRPNRYRVVAANILPEFSRLGLAPALIGRIARNAMDAGAKSLEFSWIADSNPLSFGTIENGGAVRTKTLRVYEANCSELLLKHSWPQRPADLGREAEERKECVLP